VSLILWRGIALQLIFVAVVGCGGAQPGATKASSPASWRELTSEHFDVWTNAAPDSARKLVETMEHLRQVVLGVSFFHGDVKGRSFVVAFQNIDEVHQYVPVQFIAHAWIEKNVVFEPVIVLAAESLDSDRRIVTHELTHVIAFNAIPSQPAWFAEGVAGYFETIRLDEAHATIDVGVPLENRLRQLSEGGLTPAAQLFTCDHAECMDDRYYATTWALMTYLVNERPKQLGEYMDRLVQTPAADQAQLWPAVFSDLPAEKLDHELVKWVHYGSIKVLKYNVALRDSAATEAPAAEADVLAAKGLLRYLSAPQTPSAEIARALTLDPTNVVANMINATRQKTVAPELAHSLTAAHPDDWRAWWLAWRAASDNDQSREAREKTCGLLEAHPIAVPIEACARDATGAFAEDPRRAVMVAAIPQFNECMKKSKSAERADQFSIDVDIAESGTVSAARVAVGSADTNACIEAVVKALTFPPHRSGTFHMGMSKRPRMP
jgi:Protein of unknown function (DUF1570)